MTGRGVGRGRGPLRSECLTCEHGEHQFARDSQRSRGLLASAAEASCEASVVANCALRETDTIVKSVRR